MKNYKKFLTPIIIMVMLGVTISGALASGERIEIKTRGYEKQVISFDGQQKEVSIRANMNFKERCDDCKFNSITGKGYLRFYWFDGARNAVELKKIRAENMEVSDSKVVISGVADVLIISQEGRKRVINKKVPVEITLDKNTNEMSVSFYGGTISNIQTKWR